MEDYFVYVCPKCKEQIEYFPNPAYIARHDKCGFDGGYSDLIRAVDKTKLLRDINKLEELSKRFPKVVNGKLVE